MRPMFVYKSRFLTRGETWFDGSPDGARVDWIYHRQRSSPLAGSRWRRFHTLLIDLCRTPGDLFDSLDHKTARRITEAREKDKLRCIHCDSNDPKLLDEVEAMWNQFAAAQKTAPLDRSWFEQFREAGALDVVAAKNPAGTVLVYHLVLLTPKRARQLIAISPRKAVPDVAWRNIISRANCLVHWHNFLTFRARKIPYFDFGGWYPGTTDIQLLGINTFKKGFGGIVVREFDCDEPVTIKGRVALALAQMLARLKRPRQLTNGKPRSRNDAPEPKAHKVSPAF